MRSRSIQNTWAFEILAAARIAFTENKKKKLKEEKQRIFHRKKREEKRKNENIQQIHIFIFHSVEVDLCVCVCAYVGVQCCALRLPSMIDVKCFFSRMCGGEKKNRCENEKLAAINLSMLEAWRAVDF